MGRVKPLRPSQGPYGDKRRWGLAVVIGVEEYYNRSEGWLHRTKRRLRALAEEEGFPRYTDGEFTHLAGRIMETIRNKT